MNNKFFSDLSLIQNDTDQKKAYEASNNTVVIAGPGSGKTRVLTLKAIKLCNSEIHPPSGLACISYSRETVRELKKRLSEYDYKINSYDFIGTIHGFCIIHIIEPFAHLYPEYNIPIPLKISSKKVAFETFQDVLHELNITDQSISMTRLNKQRSLSIPGSSKVQLDFFDLPKQAEETYNNILRKKGCLDFINIINIATKMIREQEYVKKTLEAKFSWLLIDEYQDLGKALHEMVLELQNRTSIKIFAVGDMNQSIYGFNGAYPEFLKELNNLSNFESIALQSNYRSNQQIIKSSLDSLQLPPPGVSYQAKQRLNENAKFTFITCEAEMDEQYQTIAYKVIPKLRKNGIKLNEIGILVSSGSEVIGMANTLKSCNIPFYIVKWSFNNSDVVQWLQDCAQWCIDSNKQSFQEIFQFWKRLLKIHNETKLLNDPIVLRSEFYEILNSSKSHNYLKGWLLHFIESLSLLDLLKESSRYPDEIKNINLLLNEVNLGNLANSELKRFANLGVPNNEITITTRHSSKGLEFEVVILLGMEEGNFPDYRIQNNSKEMEEVHRLCYVCISRAKRECILVRSKVHTIPKRNGDYWVKRFASSRFWDILVKNFGNQNNNIKAENYKV
ncbi:ATP-dependent DNA helicase UvrD/PcrA [Tenacibaculum discolor]